MKKQLTLLLLLTFSLLSAQVPTAERNALIDFYNSLSGSNWYNGANSNWTTTQPVNTWYGVTTEIISGIEHVTKIEFDRKNLNGSLPASIGNLTELKELKLVNNYDLSGDIPNELGNCTNLTSLNLSRNQLSGNIPSQLGNLSNLRVLSLYRNQLSGNIPIQLGNLSHLEYLNFFSNNLTGGIPTELGNLTALQFLVLSNNQLSGVIPDLSALTALKGMYIRNNNFHFADIEPQYSAIQTVCQANSGDYYYKPMNKVDNEDIINMVTGNNYTFTMTTINGTGVTYQWYKNDVEIPGATATTYTITNAQQSDAGDYVCKASSPIITDLTIERKVIHLYGTINPTDKASLLALYNATDGANWTNSTNWNTTQPVYTWFGVKVRGDRVTELNLQNNSLHGYLPTEIGNLVKLQILNINNMSGFYAGRMLSGSLPTEIGNLPELRELILNFHNFTGNIPVSIGNCTALTTLDLWHNQLTGSIPVSLGNLINLEVITLEENQLTGTIPTSFANCVKMGSFWLNDNQLTGDVPDIFSTMPDLFYASLYNNQLTGTVDLSNNPRVYGVFMNDMEISTLNIKNNNNTIMRYFYLTNNPNLTCVFVDDASYSTTNWTSVDVTTHFVETQSQCDALSVDDYLQNSISVYPNPTSGKININSDAVINSIVITNLTGQVVKTQDYSASIDISDLSEGVYFIKISGQDNSTAIFKIVKK